MTAGGGGDLKFVYVMNACNVIAMKGAKKEIT